MELIFFLGINYYRWLTIWKKRDTPYIVDVIIVKIKEEPEAKKQVEGQFDLFNLKLADISHELDKINVNELTPIDALNTLVKLKEMIK